ncbi:hypothetical protein K438DRAFT_1867389 [Mycena galopus ATCC 62051]|nr:hypothetical protein K438DRAFT_1867389 [Mycena galopus ATCC 62051]
MPSSPEAPPPQVHRFPATSCLPPRRSPPNGTRVKLVPKDTAAQHVSPLGPWARLRPVAFPECSLIPTPDCTLSVEAHTRTGQASPRGHCRAARLAPRPSHPSSS